MLDRLDAAELHEAGAGDRIDGLAGRIGDQMQVMGRHGRPPPARKACAWPVPRRLMAGTSSDVFPCAQLPLTTASHCSRLLLDPGRIAPTAMPVVGGAPPEVASPRYPPGDVAVQTAPQPPLSRLPPTGS